MRGWVVIAFLLIAACSGEQTAKPAYHATDNPERLSEWGMSGVSDGALRLAEGVTPYDLATPLFSDYALKLRTVWIPESQAATYDESEAFDFPVGTVFTKTFYYKQEGAAWTGAVLQAEGPVLSYNALPLEGVRLIETRVLVHRENGWAALPYVWNEDQTDAYLKRTGDVQRLTLVRTDGRAEEFAYLVPDANQCAACHATNATTRAIKPIGPKARHLNKPSTFVHGVNQLEDWMTAGLLTGDVGNAAAVPQNAVWTDETATIERRARAYLDANCAHCHNPNGAADTSGLNLEPDAQGPAMGFCKSPIAAGGGSGGRPFDIVPGAPDQSITVFRLQTTDPGAMMPELGRAVSHEEGVALIAEWIAQMDGNCG